MHLMIVATICDRAVKIGIETFFKRVQFFEVAQGNMAC